MSSTSFGSMPFAAVSVKIAFSIFEKLKYVNNQQAAIHCTVRMYS